MLPLSVFFGRKKPDISTMTEKKDIAGLIRILQSPDLRVYTGAVKALGTLGPDAVDSLIKALRTNNKPVKLGIIGALSEIRDPRSVQPLVDTLRDRNSEVRWQAAIALGEIGDNQAVEPLVHSLRDLDKYVRYGSAFSLAKMGWKPTNDTDRAYYFIGMQEWKAVNHIGKPAIIALNQLLRDRDANVRKKAIELLGEIGDSEATPALIRSLADENREVRWNAVMASPKCGISLMYLPRGLTKRPQTVKNPMIAGFLNFILPGLGYGYLGKWWGILIFQVDITATVWLFKYQGEENSYLLLFPIYLILAIHAYYLSIKMPKDPP
jgi:HEAT repeat protein